MEKGINVVLRDPVYNDFPLYPVTLVSNLLDDNKEGSTFPTTSELGCLQGIQSNVQEQLDNKTSVVITENGSSTPLDTFNIVRLTQAEYDELKNNGTIDNNAFYLTDEVGLVGEYQFINVTEQTDLNTLVEPGIYIGDTTLFLNHPQETFLDQIDSYKDYAGKSIVLVQRFKYQGHTVSGGSPIIAWTSQCFITQFIYYRSETVIGSSDGQDVDYPADMSTSTEWHRSAYQNTSASFANLRITNELDSVSTTTGALIVAGGIGASGSIYANKVYGAVWNDYAEYRICKDKNVTIGDVVVECGNDEVKLCNKRLSKATMISSDTAGMVIGDKNNGIPIAVCGRVLAYPDKPRKYFKIGDSVCSGKNGCVSKMRWYEKILFPDRILGFVSGIPDYEEWGDGKVQVNGRIWIKI